MKFPLFSEAKSASAIRNSEDRAERLLAEGLRLLSQFCSKMADYIEAQRLARAGYEKQGKFLERLERDPADATKPPDKA